jgi:hypothetical protein
MGFAQPALGGKAAAGWNLPGWRGHPSIQRNMNGARSWQPALGGKMVDKKVSVSIFIPE